MESEHPLAHADMESEHSGKQVEIKIQQHHIPYNVTIQVEAATRRMRAWLPGPSAASTLQLPTTCTLHNVNHSLLWFRVKTPQETVMPARQNQCPRHGNSTDCREGEGSVC